MKHNNPYQVMHFTLSLCTFLLLLMPVISTAAQGPAGMPGMPGAGGMMQMPAGMPPGLPADFSFGNMPMPSEQELEEALKFIEYLAEHDPKQLEMLEKLGQEMINNMNDEDLGQLSTMFNIAPDELDELREEARKGKAAPAPTPSEPAEPEPAVPTVTKTPPSVAPAIKKQVGDAVLNLIESLSSLRQKASSVREVHQLIRSWRQELRDLMFYLKVISEKQQLERLAQAEFKALQTNLNNLYGVLKVEEPRIILPDDLVLEDNAYDLLGVPTGATNKKIEEAFKKLEKEYNQETLKAQLTAQGLSEKDIKRQLKAKKLAFEVIEDAYEQLTDVNLRKQIDREIEAQSKKSAQDIATATEALGTITTALGNSIYAGELLTLLEKFLQKNAPAELAKKQEMDKAEKKQIEEQKRLGAITPTRTPGSFEPRVESPRGSSYDNDYGYYNDFAPYMYDDYYDYPGYAYNDQKQPQAGQKGEDATGQSDDSKKDKESDKDKKDKKDSRVVPKKTKTEKRSTTEIIKNIGTNLDAFKKELDKAASQELVNSLAPYMKEATRTVTKKVEEPEGESLQRLFQEPVDLGTETVQEKAVPDKSKNTQLEKLYENTKIQALAEDIKALNEILRNQKSDKRSDEENKAWSKLEEQLEKTQTHFITLNTKLKESLEGAVMPEKATLHGPVIRKMLQDTATFVDRYETVSKKYF